MSARYTRRSGLFGEKRLGTDQQYFTRYYQLGLSAHWQPYIAQILGQQTDIDIYLDRHVVRPGRYLSLHDEVKKLSVTALAAQYDYRCGLAAGARLCCYLDSAGYAAEIHSLIDESAQTIEATSVKQLADAGVRVGDTLRISGTGMCNFALPEPGARKPIHLFYRLTVRRLSGMTPAHYHYRI